MTNVDHPPANRRALLALGLIAALTAAAHLLFGLYYATRAESLAQRPSLSQRGEEFLASYPAWNTPLERDSTFYNRTAWSILQTGLPRRFSGDVTLHAPFYSYFLAGCYALGGVRLWPVAAAQAVLSGLTALALGLAAMRIGQPQRLWVGAGAALLYLINLRIAMYVGYIYPTILALTLFGGAFCLASLPLTNRRLAGGVVLLALGTFSQANFFLLAGACALWLFWQWRLPAAVAATVIGAVALLKMSVGVFLAEQKQTDVFWEANNPYYESMRWTSAWEQRPGNPWTKWSSTAAEQQRYDEYLRRAQQLRTDPGLLWIKENPWQYAKLCAIRLRTTLGPFTGQMSPRNRALSTVYWLLIFPLGYYGWWRARHLPVSRLALCVFLVLTAFETLVITEWYLRYRLPVDLMLTVFAAVGFSMLLRARPTKPQSLR